ncbi:chromatin target of PRMT1 protein-like isoform X1 [Pseudoliparis swirei]|uniref:chromatin target of PRMT1 protein-like isoform X1 n=1 Tax=Pseudoliparis swirei TaxID=2059687 RepID=UPI0024BE2F4B|nr:chromatin target of PRMT1 protein-like isoform X1 [Pseudoliparis swirei]XP_056262024.1 chromatin target of PRMT1 protein-like isoform X1 [Pseudoliparis swirei]
MDSSAPCSVYPRSSTTLTLHQRFSQVQEDQLTGSRTFDPVPLQQPKGRGPPQVFLLMKRERPSRLHPQVSPWRPVRGPCPPGEFTSWSVPVQTRYLSLGAGPRCRRRSVWTRLGGPLRPPGFWSFVNKYRTRTSRGPENLHRRLGQRRKKRNIRKHKGRTHLQRGGASASRGRGFSKEQLDAQLEDYMSRSKSRLDAQLDEYMSMAGQAHWAEGLVLDWNEGV